MYDQVKIDRIQCKITPVKWSFNTQDNHTQQAITIVTAWDRSGLSDEQVKIIKNNVAADGENEGIIGTNAVNNKDGLYLVINDDISTYSSAMTKQLNPGSSFTNTRCMYPSSLQEKSQFINTSNLDEWYKEFDTDKCRYIGIKEPNRVYSYANNYDGVNEGDYIAYMKNSPAISGNPCFLLEDPAIAFKPTLLIGCLTSYTNVDQIQYDDDLAGPVYLNIEADIGVTFRGLRKAKITE